MKTAQDFPATGKPVTKLVPDCFSQQQQMFSDRDFLNLTHRLDARRETDIRDHPVPRVETKRMRPSVFATKLFDKPVFFPVEPTDPYTVTGEIHKSDADRQQCGGARHTAVLPSLLLPRCLQFC